MSTTTKNDSEAHPQEKKATSAKQTMDDEKPASTATTAGEATKAKDANLEQAFFFGLTIDDALNSSDNLSELFYNACKYNHLELVRRCVEEKQMKINETFMNDYPLCIAR